MARCIDYCVTLEGSGQQRSKNGADFLPSQSYIQVVIQYSCVCVCVCVVCVCVCVWMRTRAVNMRAPSMENAVGCSCQIKLNFELPLASHKR